MLGDHRRHRRARRLLIKHHRKNQDILSLLMQFQGVGPAEQLVGEIVGPGVVAGVSAPRP